MKRIFYQILIVLILISNVGIPIFNVILLYVILYFGAKQFDPLNPLLWVYLSWNILFINAFSGILHYNTNVDLFIPIVLCISLIIIFFFGYILDKVTKKSTSKLEYKISNITTEKAQKASKLFSLLSIIAAILFSIEIIFIYNGNILAPGLLRETFGNRQATIYSQLSGVLYFGGLFSISAFFLLKDSPNRFLYILGIFAFALGSLLSAGRQMVFQIILASIICLLFLKFHKINPKISYKHKLIFSLSIFLILGYFIFISAFRNSMSINEKRSKAEIFSSMSNYSYDTDFISTIKYFPAYIEDFTVDYTFYFSHEIILFAEWWSENDLFILNGHFLQFSPFIERQFDRLNITNETQKKRLENESKKNHKGSIIAVGWPTTNAALLQNVGFIGAFIIVFLHGFFSHKLYYLTKTKTTFGLLNLSIANNIVLFNTISNSAFSETQILFYIVVSFWLIKNKI